MKYQTILLLAAALLCTTATLAQSSWGDHTRNGEWAFSRGDFDRAEEEFRAALDMAQAFPQGDRRLETSLGNLARFYEHRMNMDKAQPMYQLLLAAQEARVGRDQPILLPTLSAIGRVAVGQGDVPTAVEHLELYASLAESSGAADPAEHGRTLLLLARTLSIQDRGAEALPYQRHAVAMLGEAPSVDPVERADATETLAQMEMLDGSAEAAELLVLESIQLRASAGEPVNASIVLTAAAETALSSANFEAANRLATRALDLTEESGGDAKTTLRTHKVLANGAWMQVRRGVESLTDLLLVAGDTPQLAAAEENLELLYELAGKSTPPDLVTQAECANRLVRVSIMRDQLDQAMQWQKRCIDLAEVEPAAESVAQLHQDLVDLLLAADRKELAVEANAALINELESTWGEASAKLLPPLERQELLLKEIKRKKEARAIKKRIKKLKKGLR